MKPSLSLNKVDLENYFLTLGLNELCGNLINSGLFDISYHNERITVGDKGMRACILIYNGKKVYLDLWEYIMPTYSRQIFDYNPDIIIKLQHTPKTRQMFDNNCARKKILIDVDPEKRWAFYNKVVPWTFFPSKMMKPYVGKEDSIKKLPIEIDGFFCGKNWKARHGMSLKLMANGIEYLQSEQAVSGGRPLNDEEFLHKMLISKYGIVLHGRGSFLTEAKNRREIDYMMIKKPLLLNYRPHYYDPMIEGEHYIYIDEQTDFKKIQSNYNLEKIAMNGYDWYQRNASPIGSATLFMKIMKQKLGV